MLCTHCSNEVKPVVCLDIDGNLGDYHGSFLQFSARYLDMPDEGIAMTYRGETSLADHLGISKEMYRAVKLAFRQGGNKRWMPVFPGARELSLALRNAGVEVWITTTRPYMRLDNIDPDTREWLRRNEIYYDHIFYEENKYLRLCEMVDADRVVCVLDDELEHIEYARIVGLPVIWRQNQYNAAQRPLLHGGSALTWVRSLPEAWTTMRPLLERWRSNHG